MAGLVPAIHAATIKSICNQWLALSWAEASQF
jgi:hypothetical protein